MYLIHRIALLSELINHFPGELFASIFRHLKLEFPALNDEKYFF